MWSTRLPPVGIPVVTSLYANSLLSELNYNTAAPSGKPMPLGNPLTELRPFVVQFFSMLFVNAVKSTSFCVLTAAFRSSIARITEASEPASNLTKLLYKFCRISRSP